MIKVAINGFGRIGVNLKLRSLEEVLDGRKA